MMPDLAHLIESEAVLLAAWDKWSDAPSPVLADCPAPAYQAMLAWTCWESHCYCPLAKPCADLVMIGRTSVANSHRACARTGEVLRSMSIIAPGPGATEAD